MNKYSANKWSDYFSRCRNLPIFKPKFYIKESKYFLQSYDGYSGGHDTLDDIIGLCDNAHFKKTTGGSDSPLNIQCYEISYEFLDGGFEIFGGNYFFGDNPQGSYIYGFKALRWILYQLNLNQPQLLKGEVAVYSHDELESQVTLTTKSQKLSSNMTGNQIEPPSNKLPKFDEMLKQIRNQKLIEKQADTQNNGLLNTQKQTTALESNLTTKMRLTLPDIAQLSQNDADLNLRIKNDMGVITEFTNNPKQRFLCHNYILVDSKMQNIWVLLEHTAYRKNDVITKSVSVQLEKSNYTVIRLLEARPKGSSHIPYYAGPMRERVMGWDQNISIIVDESDESLCSEAMKIREEYLRTTKTSKTSL
ncbi:MAG: hypothetical protein KUF72_00415 [Candidatus Thiodiazotropha sp. (ex Ctena orbiculata)]|nr:hypothetical protein [Candidatus Thiodiazotropha taylori]